MTGNFDRDIETEIFSWNEWNVVPFDSFYSLYIETLKYSSKRFNFTRFLLPHLFISTQSEQFIRRLSKDKRSSYFFTMTTLETSNVKSRHIDPRRAASLLTLWLSFPCAPLSFSCAPTPTRNRLWKYTNSCTEGKKSWIELSVPEATSL